MKKLLGISALLFAAAFAQGQAYSSLALQNSPGSYARAIPYAQLTLCVSTDTATPCTQKAAIFTDDSLTTRCTATNSSGTLTNAPISGANCNNPGISDGNGNFTIYALAGNYRLCTFGQTTLCQEITVGGGGTGNITCPGANNGALAAWLNSTTVGCTNLAYTDFAGGLFSQFYQALGPHNGEVQLTTVGVVPILGLPAHTLSWVAPNVVPTSLRMNAPGVECTDGQVWQQLSHGADPTGTENIYFNCLTPSVGGGTQFQVNTVNLLNCSGSVCPLQNLLNATASFGYGMTFSNSSGGIIQPVAVTPFTTASNPTAPTLTPTNPGSTSYTYGVAGCEDPGCTRHSALVTTATATGNATLNNTNPIKLTAYADTLYGYRFYVICRTASSGSPASVGVIGSGAWKQFSDNGITADGSTCSSTYASNNTKLDDHCLGGNPSITNAMLSVPCGTDTPPASPNALDDEGTATFGSPGDANSPFWTWVNQNSATSSYTGGTLVMNSPSRAASDNLNCLVQTAPATPYTFTALIYEDFGYTDGSVVRTINAQHGVVFRESGTSKLMTWGGQAHTTNVISALLTEWTNTTTQNGTFPVSSNGLAMNPSFWRIQNDGTNINFSSSTDGITYVTQFSQAKNAFFTTAPDQVGICIDNNAGETALALDYWRRTQ